MRKRNSVNIERMVIGMILIFGMFFVSGCSDSELEQKNTQLKEELAKVERFNTSLSDKLKNIIQDNNSLKNTLEKMRENNKGLSVSLAKSELEFFKKHKAELDKDRKELDKERKIFKQKKLNIEKEAYANAKQTVSTMYLFIIGFMVIVLLIILVLLFINRRNNMQAIKENDKDVKKITSEKMAIEEVLKVKEDALNDLGNKIKELERIQKAGQKNQVVSKIEEYKVGRERKLNSLIGDGFGN